MRPSTAQRRRSLATGAALALFGVVVLGFSASPASAQRPDTPGAPASDVSNIPKPITDTFDRVNLRNRRNDAELGRTTAENDTTCLLRRPVADRSQGEKGISPGLRSFEGEKNRRSRKAFAQCGQGRPAVFCGVGDIGPSAGHAGEERRSPQCLFPGNNR